MNIYSYYESFFFLVTNTHAAERRLMSKKIMHFTKSKYT